MSSPKVWFILIQLHTNIEYVTPVPGTTEMHALQLMIKTYTETPEFGDASKFQDELDLVIQKVHKLSKTLPLSTENLLHPLHPTPMSSSLRFLFFNFSPR